MYRLNIYCVDCIEKKVDCIRKDEVTSLPKFEPIMNSLTSEFLRHDFQFPFSLFSFLHSGGIEKNDKIEKREKKRNLKER